MAVCGPCYYALVRVSLKAQIELATNYLLTLYLVSQPTHKDFEFQTKVDFQEFKCIEFETWSFFHTLQKSRERKKQIDLFKFSFLHIFLVQKS